MKLSESTERVLVSIFLVCFSLVCMSMLLAAFAAIVVELRASL